jgi:hypothetical protein
MTDFTIENISLPPEVEQALDTRSKMGVLGNLDAYTKLKAADAIGIAAANPGLGGAGVGMGVGFGLGNAMGGMMGSAAGAQGAFNPQTGMQGAGPPPPPMATRYHYAGVGGQAELSAAEIAQRVAADRNGNHMVWAAGFPAWKSWRDVPEIAGQVPPPPAAAPPPPPGANITFHYHGPGGNGEKSASEIAGLLRADPSAAHHVWKAGFDAWKPAKDVPEISALVAGPPPPPGAPPPPPM